MVDIGDRIVSRRTFIRGAVTLSSVALMPAAFARSSEAEFRVSKTARDALERSKLIYISPLKSDGEESSCHGEVWFFADGADLLVVTTPDRWRYEAVERGLDRARIWVGDFGVWKSSHGAFRNGPSFVARVDHISSDTAAVARTLKAMAPKYADEGWVTYGPKFEKGLADGSRVLLRYRPIAD